MNRREKKAFLRNMGRRNLNNRKGRLRYQTISFIELHDDEGNKSLVNITPQNRKAVMEMFPTMKVINRTIAHKKVAHR